MGYSTGNAFIFHFLNKYIVKNCHLPHSHWLHLHTCPQSNWKIKQPTVQCWGKWDLYTGGNQSLLHASHLYKSCEPFFKALLESWKTEIQAQDHGLCMCLGLAPQMCLQWRVSAMTDWRIHYHEFLCSLQQTQCPTLTGCEVNRKRGKG